MRWLDVQAKSTASLEEVLQELVRLLTDAARAETVPLGERLAVTVEVDVPEIAGPVGGIFDWDLFALEQDHLVGDLTSLHLHERLVHLQAELVERLHRIRRIEDPLIELLQTDLTIARIDAGVLAHRLHQVEVVAHLIGEAGQAAELRDEEELLGRATTDLTGLGTGHQQRLLVVLDDEIVPGLVIVLVRDRFTLLGERAQRIHAELDAINTVRGVVIIGDDNRAHHCVRHRGLALAIEEQVVDRVHSQNFVRDFGAQQNVVLVLPNRGDVAGPQLQIVVRDGDL